MKTRILYIFILVILSIGSFFLGWYEHKTADPKISTPTTLNEYDQYVSSLDSICPFVSTAFTGDCLDKEINKQEQQYNLLSKEILSTLKVAVEKVKAQNIPIDLEISNILFDLPPYNKTRDTYIEQLCALKLALVTGTAIIEESRKCTMYYNFKDIQMLENLNVK